MEVKREVSCVLQNENRYSEKKIFSCIGLYFYRLETSLRPKVSFIKGPVLGRIGRGGQLWKVTRKQDILHIHEGTLYIVVCLQRKAKENEIKLGTIANSHSGFLQPSNNPLNSPKFTKQESFKTCCRLIQVVIVTAVSRLNPQNTSCCNRFVVWHFEDFSIAVCSAQQKKKNKIWW